MKEDWEHYIKEYSNLGAPESIKKLKYGELDTIAEILLTYPIAICPDCHRVKLRAEEIIIVSVELNDFWTTGIPKDVIGKATEDSHREHKCRHKVGDKIRVWETRI